MATPQQTLDALDQAIFTLASTGIQSYTMPDGKTVTRTSLKSLREQAEILRQQIALDEGSADGSDPMASHVQFGDWS